MPDEFTTSAKMMAIYDETLEGCTVVTSCRLASCYRKQGTSVPVRLYVIDKRPGYIKPSVISRDTVAELCEAVDIAPRAQVARPAPPPVAALRRPSSSLFKAVRSAKQSTSERVRQKPAAKSSAVAPLDYKTLQTPRPLGKQAGVYLPYRPSRIDIAGAGEHPTPFWSIGCDGFHPGAPPLTTFRTCLSGLSKTKLSPKRSSRR